MLGIQSKNLQKILVSTLGAVILLLILILFNVFFSYANLRLDITEDRLYSLSPGTKQILNHMSQPVTIKFFYSRSQRNLPPELKLYAQQIMDFLSEYERAGRGKIKIETYDPKPDSDEEEWAQRYGLQAVQTEAGDNVYAGLVFLALDQEEKIEALDPAREKLLEYDITRLIYRLQTVQKKQIGILTSLPVFGQSPNPMMPNAQQGQGPWYFVSELHKTYDVREIDPADDKIDPALNLLMIIAPNEINPKLLYAIDQYVLAGGKALVFVDPFCAMQAKSMQQPMLPPGRSSLEKLLKAWGIGLDFTKIVADMDQYTSIQGLENPVVLTVRGSSFNNTDIVTMQLQKMVFPLTGALNKLEGNDYLFEPLIQSSTNAGLIQSFVANFGTSALRRGFTAEGKRLNLAVRVRGKFKTAFPDGMPQESKPQPNQAPQTPVAHLLEAKEPATVLVVADADFLADPFYLQQNPFLGYVISNDNLNFVANACETLTGSDALVSLRSRGSFERPFTKVLDLERRAQTYWLAKEKELEQKADAANERLRQLEQQKDASQKTILSPEQQAEILRFKEERRQINQELKEVRKNLRADIEALGARLKLLNIFLMPLLVAAAGIAFGLYRQKRTKQK